MTLDNKGSDPLTEEWRFDDAVRGYVWRSAAPRAMLLLQHGLAEYSERYVDHYNRLVPSLVERGVDVYAYDLPGHGRSPGARGLADIAETVRLHIKARRRLAETPLPLFLFGHSLGGLITAASIAENAAGAAGVILSAPALLIDAHPALRWFAETLSKVAPGLRILPAINPNDLSRIESEAEAYRNDPMIGVPSPTLKLAATLAAVAQSGWSQYSAWKTPALIMHGEQDRATDPEGSKRFAEMIAAEDKTLRLFPEGRHELLNDLDRDEALRLILDWIEKRI